MIIGSNGDDISRLSASSSAGPRRLTAAGRVRVPEPMLMDEPEAAAAFHRAGDDGGLLTPQYELCARGMSCLLPRDGVVLDLGSGSGRYLAYLAARRPDAQILGLELSEPMLALGEQLLAAKCLDDRVGLVPGDMTNFLDLAPERVDLLSCVLALHQLPSAAKMTRSLQQIATIRKQTGCAVWIWDFARLSDRGLMKECLSLAPDQEPLVLRDALASEAASWTLAELTDALDEAGLSDLQHCVSRPPFLQVHWATHHGASGSPDDAVWHEIAIPHAIRGMVTALRAGFGSLPG